jgi:hypothetical protein
LLGLELVKVLAEVDAHICEILQRSFALQFFHETFDLFVFVGWRKNDVLDDHFLPLWIEIVRNSSHEAQLRDEVGRPVIAADLLSSLHLVIDQK